MSAKDKVVFDHDNPEWTDEDFAKAERFDGIPIAELAAFPRTRGRPKGATAEVTKQQVTLRLDRDVIERFRAGGPGWQSRMNETLRRGMG